MYQRRWYKNTRYLRIIINVRILEISHPLAVISFCDSLGPAVRTSMGPRCAKKKLQRGPTPKFLHLIPTPKYSCLQNPWRELPRSGYPTNFWLQRSAMGGQSDISNVDVINCVGSFLNRLEMKLFKRRCPVDI